MDYYGAMQKKQALQVTAHHAPFGHLEKEGPPDDL